MRAFPADRPIVESGGLLQAGPKWYAVHTRSRFEKAVHVELRNKGIETYLPATVEVHAWKDRRKQVDVPLFPGYVLVRFEDLAAERVRVLQTHGVVRILGHGSTLTPVAEEEIEAVRRLVDTRAHSSYPYIRSGMRVRVCRGVLSGVEGFLVRARNATRLVISVPLLAQSVSVEIDAADVKPLG